MVLFLFFSGTVFGEQIRINYNDGLVQFETESVNHDGSIYISLGSLSYIKGFEYDNGYYYAGNLVEWNEDDIVIVENEKYVKARSISELIDGHILL